MVFTFIQIAVDFVTSSELGNNNRGPSLQMWSIGVWVTRCWWVQHVCPSLWCLSRNTAVGGTRARRWQQRTTLNSAGRLGNSCLEQFVWQVRLLRLERRTTGPLYLLILTEDLVSAMEPVDSVLASKDIHIVGARTSWEAGGWGCGIAVSGVLDCVLTSRQGIVLQLPRAAGS